MVWKVTDFGLASQTTASRTWDLLAAMPMNGCRAPEWASTGNLTDKVDIWNMGLVLYELVFDEPPFRNDLSVYQYYKENATLVKSPNEMSDFGNDSDKMHLSDVLSGLLAKEPSKRPTAFDVGQLFLSYSANEQTGGDTLAQLPESEPVIRRGAYNLILLILTKQHHNG